MLERMIRERAISASAMLALLICAAGCRLPWKSSLPEIGTGADRSDVRLIPNSEKRPIQQASRTQHKDEIAELPDAPFEQRQRGGRWSQWLNRLSMPKRIPLPRTDLRMEEPHEMASDAGESLSDF